MQAVSFRQALADIGSRGLAHEFRARDPHVNTAVAAIERNAVQVEFPRQNADQKFGFVRDEREAIGTRRFVVARAASSEILRVEIEFQRVADVPVVRINRSDVDARDVLQMAELVAQVDSG